MTAATMRLVDEDDFRLAVRLVQHWRQTSDGSDPELIDRIATLIGSLRADPRHDLLPKEATP